MNALDTKKCFVKYLDDILAMKIEKIIFSYDQPIASISENFISRIIIPLAGKQEIFYAAENKIKTYPLKPGEIFYSVRNGWAWITERGKHLPFEIISIIFRPEYTRIIHVKNDDSAILAIPDLYCHIPADDNVAIFINQALNQLAYTHEKRLPQIKALLIGLLYEISFQMKNTESAKSSKAQSTFQIIVEYLNENYNRPINRDTVSNDLNLASSYVSRLFRLKTGNNFSSYLKMLRFNKACYLLKYSQETISSVAQQCGFNSASYFVKAFKETYKLTPTQYRLHKE